MDALTKDRPLEERFYTVPEVAKILRVKKGFVYELVYTGRLKRSGCQSGEYAYQKTL
ncbi:MAG: helix-turn-helix domain-containing protein [Desulfotomaculaceae bacterium]|nr:helix-turn-helix domain-containing protein [Desulfotomaculaceae bacterium]